MDKSDNKEPEMNWWR